MKTSTRDDNLIRVCDTCRRPENAHPYRHPFISDGVLYDIPSSRDDRPIDDAASPDNGAQGRVRILPTGDPVMRLLLIRKGLVTVEDIEQIEAELRATGVAGYDPSQSLG